MKILLITPPLTQLNTPYPATAYLKGFLVSKGFQVAQADLGIELVLKVFNANSLRKIFDIAESREEISENIRRILKLKREYFSTIGPVVKFLQGKNSTLAHSICNTDFLPRASRFDQLQDLDWAFGSMGIQDQAKHLATLYIEDLGDLIIETVDKDFGFSRYAERLGRTASSFNPIQEKLNEKSSLLDDILGGLLTERLNSFQPDVIGFSVPFPGNLYGAFKCAQLIKEYFPKVKTIMGGGYPNTELRKLKDNRVFKYFDYISLDDGEGPIMGILERIASNSEDTGMLQRTYILDRDNNEVKYCFQPQAQHISHAEVGTPDYSDLPLDDYLSIIEVVNPMHRMWSDGRWNKMTIAHGCYWKKCSFCDVSLDYISRYDAAPAEMLVDRIETIVEQTGQNGFHFVDEAAPPLVLRDFALELLRRNVKISWWTNIRFEKTFSADLCRLLAASGCIAVTGGLEVASDRLLQKMKKGVSIEQVARVTRDFTNAGIMVHAYLMYGFPTQTAQETIDSLEVVRQLFEHNVIQSGFWHQFAMTAHSPVGKNPEAYEVVKIGPEFKGFAENDLFHQDPKGCDHERFGSGLSKAIFNYMHGLCLDWPVEEWFDFKVPKTKEPYFRIEQAIEQKGKKDQELIDHKVYWLGAQSELEFFTAKKKGKTVERAKLLLDLKSGREEIAGDKQDLIWLQETLDVSCIENEKFLSVIELMEDYEKCTGKKFNKLASSHIWHAIRDAGLVLIR
ncbi:radical SAM superfamily enzyme YgiQ (UPF0313 family) [Aureibacter tunicatorum]|uniref:Radical SAM superfamily enzyme YgiQ (UPF0313 family) n=1 Tax=Aureibacter tunicatorum TaxID=866807 RepID=A0AAE3XTL5_9BACT|nr:radical SAM superfamily enzyme YgiQ (UPF0313 family) [Aureibacter tunicatorum]BDD07248.1 radical SAM protein [Aureibacter tunicatorum]